MTLAPPPTSILKEGSLFLDFDGTLVTFADRPDAVRMEPSLIEVLAHLHTLLDGRLAILTGRSIADVREFLAPLNLAVAGSHGLERADAKTTIESTPPSEQLNQAIEHLRDFAADRPGILVEEKPMSVALHYRAAPGAEEECFEAAQRTAVSTGFTIQPGNMVLELKPACSDKGTALEQFMDEAPFRGSRPVFLGDDLTDEHGFLAARRLGGVGVLVGEYRETAAGFLLENVGAVHDWLRAASEDF
jgi:trehalose 6-phosphate phosphatase